MPKTIEISHRTILFTFGVLLFSWIAFQIRDIVFLLFISFILMTAVRPFVDWLAKRKVPRPLAILLLYVILFGGVGGVIGSTIPVMSAQSARLVAELPNIANRVMPSLNFDLRSLTQEIAPLTQNLLKVGVEIVNNVVTIVTILVFTFYLILSWDSLIKNGEKYLSHSQFKKISTLLIEIEEKIGAWSRGQLLLMVTIGVLTYIGLLILGVEYALPLAVLAGLLEVVPMVGPIVSAVPAVLFALTVSPFFAVSVAALYFVIQQFENHLIVPFVMKKSVGLSPIVTIIAFMVGARFEGVVGAILAIPLVVVAKVILSNLLNWKEGENSGAKTS